jgi:hypothetical protein
MYCELYASMYLSLFESCFNVIIVILTFIILFHVFWLRGAFPLLVAAAEGYELVVTRLLEGKLYMEIDLSISLSLYIYIYIYLRVFAPLLYSGHFLLVFLLSWCGYYFAQPRWQISLWVCSNLPTHKRSFDTCYAPSEDCQAAAAVNLTFWSFAIPCAYQRRFCTGFYNRTCTHHNFSVCLVVLTQNLRRFTGTWFKSFESRINEKKSIYVIQFYNTTMRENPTLEGLWLNVATFRSEFESRTAHQLLSYFPYLVCLNVSASKVYQRALWSD